MANRQTQRPTSRAEFITYIKTILGEPVIHVDVSDTQVEIAVDESLKYFQEFNFNGSWHAYYIHQITQTDLDNGYIDIPDDIIGVTDVFTDVNTSSGLGLNMNIYSGAWQLNYDLIFNMGSLSGSFLTYYMNKTYYDMLQQLLVGLTPIRYNKHRNRVYIDKKNFGSVGSNVVLDCWQVVDPDVDTDVWSDRWLIRYATAKLKIQWGTNVSKFTGMTLPNGVQIDGQRILQEGQQELKEIEDNAIRDYSEPPRDYTG